MKEADRIPDYSHGAQKKNQEAEEYTQNDALSTEKIASKSIPLKVAGLLSERGNTREKIVYSLLK